MRRIRRERLQVELLRRSDLAYWTARFGVSAEVLKLAVLKVGPRCERVAEELERKP